VAGLIPDERREQIAALERASARAWPTRESAPLFGWILRCGGAQSRRLNSVDTAHFEAGAEVRAAIDGAAAWYGARGLPPCFRLAEGAQPAGLDGRLAARGYAQQTPTQVLTAQAALIASRGAPAPELLPDATPDVQAAIGDPGWSASVRAERAELYERIPAPRCYALLRAEGQPAAAGLCVLDGELAGIFSMRTQRGFRRRGLGGALLGALAAWARDAGARTLYLQVEDDNPARSLYARVGFTPLYAYHYRELASDGSARR
jgi:GNAT superfamily N-acetyltransferase